MKITLKELEFLVKNGFTPKISTPSGMEKITDTYRKSSDGVILTFSDSSEIKCANNHLIQIENNWVPAKNLSIRQKINGKTIIKIEQIPFQEWVDFSIDAEHESYHHNGMTHHNSGKTIILFIVLTFIIKYKLAKKFLLLVPTISLIHQMKKDFISYCSFDKIRNFFEENIHCQIDGAEKFSNKPITISCWQSAIHFPKEYLESFDCVVADEVHLMSKDSGQSILEDSISTSYRIGLTGTLQEVALDLLVLEGLFGKPFQFVTTKELIDRGQVADLRIKNIILNYSDPLRKMISTLTYQEEYDLIISLPSRMKVITDFVSSLKKNTLVLFTRIEKHGDFIFDELKKKNPNKIVLYISGKNKAEEREASRVLLEENNNVLIVASFGVYSTGLSVNNIHNVVLSSPYKSKIKILQSIGRGLRLHSEKDVCTVYDFVDNAKFKNKQNYFLSHFLSRYELYQKEGFDVENINHPVEII